jgi:Flp pilus assembly protein TadG
MVELAIVMPVVLIVLIGVVQFALVYHAKNVAATAAQEGARLAAAEDRTAAEGAERTREVLRSGLGKRGEEFGVTAEDGEETVVVRAEGEYPLIIPWVTGNTIPISASSEVRKEGFRSGP